MLIGDDTITETWKKFCLKFETWMSFVINRKSYPFFVYRLVQIQGSRPRKQTKNGVNGSFLSTGHSEIGERGSESRQKTGKRLIFVYRLVQIRPVRFQKQNKISKIWKNVLPLPTNSARAALIVEQNLEKLKKYSNRLPLPKHFGLRLRANLRNQRFARNLSQVQRLSR